MRKLLFLRTAFASALLCSFTFVSPAHAEEPLVSLSCVLHGTQSGPAQAIFTPALVPGGTSSVMSLNVVLTNCVGPKADEFQNATYYITGGTVTAGSGLNPCSLRLKAAGTVVIHWNNGQHSYGTTTFNTDPAQGPISLNVVYPHGNDPLYNHVVTFLGTLIPNLDCLFNGLSTLTIPIGLYTFHSEKIPI